MISKERLSYIIHQIEILDELNKETGDPRTTVHEDMRWLAHALCNVTEIIEHFLDEPSAENLNRLKALVAVPNKALHKVKG